MLSSLRCHVVVIVVDAFVEFAVASNLYVFCCHVIVDDCVVVVAVVDAVVLHGPRACLLLYLS